MHNEVESMTFAPLGEQAVVVSFGTSTHARVHQRIVRLAKRLAKAPFPGFQECVPAFTTLCVYFDLLELMKASGGERSPFRMVCDFLEQLDRDAESNNEQAAETADIVHIPICYCSECGPDLLEVADDRGMSAEEAIRIHSTAVYTVSFIGFMPGFPYLSGLDESLHIPRLKTPRTLVPQGSVGIADHQTGIYPQPSPGGWRLIGRTPRRLFHPEARPPSLLDIGDKVTFLPITHEEFERGAADDGFSG